MWSAFPKRLFQALTLKQNSSQFQPPQPILRLLAKTNILVALGVAGIVLLLRSSGLLQGAEWTLGDIFLRVRSTESADNRLLVVGIDETDLQELGQWPVPDGVLAQAIATLKSYEPAAIGLDLYRDLPVEPGHETIVRLFEEQSNLIGIEKLENQQQSAVPPPKALADRDAVGFNNTFVDSDGIVRRNYLYLKDVAGNVHQSFALKLALAYLDKYEIKTERAPNGDLQLGQVVVPKFQSYDGPYIRADSRGYQFLANYRGPAKRLPSVTLRQVLRDEVPPELIRDRVVLIGSTAPSIRDVFVTPYSRSLLEAQQEVPGVFLQAEFVGQLLDGALLGRPFVRTWSEAGEIIWIVAWAGIGAIVSWRLKSVKRSLAAAAVAIVGLTAFGYGAYLFHWWVPVVPAWATVVGSTAAIVSYQAYLGEELRKSKEFLQSIINTIPDPIFVKDSDRRLIVLNEAYCQLVGYPIDNLVNGSEFEVFPELEALAFQEKDELVWETGLARETEETLTDAQGQVHVLATKRSLHRDGAGNRFLVGVIRDITERKRMEEQLKQVAAELAQSNAELQQDANHDQLTGLPNRKLFQERLQQSIEWAQNNQKLVGLMFLDLDGFKEVNDTLGHAMGDILLQAVANRLSGSLRGSDTVARLGGDEFTVILPGIPSIGDSTRVAEKIVKTLSQPFELDTTTVSVTTSIGIGLYPTHSEHLEDLIQLADEAMFEAKKQGKNRYCVAVAASTSLESPEAASSPSMSEGIPTKPVS